MPVPYPGGSTYLESTWTVLSNYWHPVARISEVGDTPLAARLLDVPLVLYRTSAGIQVATDICPHRGARLAGGWVRNDRLVCPYHGLEFDSSGQCVRVPASEPYADNCAAIHLQTVSWCERYGIVLVCLSGTPGQGLPDWPGLESPNIQVIPMAGAVWDASPGRHAENFNDVAHLSFIHAGTFGNPADPLVEAFAEAGADILSVHPESGPHLHRTLMRIRALGKKAGVVLNPATPLSCLDHVLDLIRTVQKGAA